MKNEKYPGFLTIFDHLSTSPEKSINAIVNQTLSVTGSKCAIYARLNEQNLRLALSVATEINARFPKTIRANGQICYEVSMNGHEMPVAFEDLRATPYFKRDFLVRRFRFKSYLGCPVRMRGKSVGSLFVMDIRKRLFASYEKRAIAALAKAIALEEERKTVQEALDKRVACEKMLVDISRRAISVEEVNGLLDWCVRRMGKTLDIDGIFVWHYDQKTDTLSNVSEWLVRNCPRHRERFQSIPASNFPWIMKALRRNKIINYQNIEEMPQDKERKLIRMIGIKSILIIPLFVRSAFYGAIGFKAYRNKRTWLEDDIYILRIVSQIISKSIENVQFERALEMANSELERRIISQTAKLRAATRQLKTKQVELQDSRLELEKLNTALLETNKALLVFARNAKKSREDIKRNIGCALRERIIPIVEELLSGELPPGVRAELDIMHMYLQDLVKGYPKGREFSSIFTPVQARVAAMVKNGLRNQDIAEELGVSVETVKSHRRNIRQKLKIRNEKINLRSFLECKWREIE